jgi:hypothetical protein
MAKTTAKPAAKTATKTSARKTTSTSAASPSIEKVSEEVLAKLQSLGIEQQLQSELEWCLGSYRSDQNPSGLYEMVDRALIVLNTEKEKKTKGVTAKFVADVEKALKSR